MTNPNNCGKLCIAFDAAAEQEGTFPNKNLVQGPGMTKNLSVLLRFWQRHVGIVADLKAMRHQVHVYKQDQEA